MGAGNRNSLPTKPAKDTKVPGAHWTKGRIEEIGPDSLSGIAAHRGLGECWLIPTSLSFWRFFVGRPLADAPSACKQAAYRLKSKYNQASV